MRTALAVFAVLLAAGFSGCAMNSNGYGGSGGLLSGLGGGCKTGCGQGCDSGCDSGCGCESSDCGSCGDSCGCNDYKPGLFPGPFASMKINKKNCGGCCSKPCNGMGELALFNSRKRSARPPMRTGRVQGRMGGQLAGMVVSSDSYCDSCGSSDSCDCSSQGLVGGGLLKGRMSGGRMGGGRMSGGRMGGGRMGGMLASTEPRWNDSCGGCGTRGCRGGCLGGGQLKDQMKSRVIGGFLTGKGEIYGMGMRRCGAGCRRCGGRGLCLLGGLRKGDPAAQHPYGGQIPHTDGFNGPHGPMSPTYAYPYYTTRGPRDFLMNNPPTIGR